MSLVDVAIDLLTRSPETRDPALCGIVSDVVPLEVADAVIVGAPYSYKGPAALFLATTKELRFLVHTVDVGGGADNPNYARLREAIRRDPTLKDRLHVATLSPERMAELRTPKKAEEQQRLKTAVNDKDTIIAEQQALEHFISEMDLPEEQVTDLTEGNTELLASRVARALKYTPRVAKVA